MFPLETARLLLRPFTEADLDAFHSVVGDPEVMARTPAGVSRDRGESEQRLRYLIDHQDDHGYSLWAMVEKDTGDVVGDCGLMLVEGTGPDAELAYHLRLDRWGRGYVTEAARECIRFGLKEVGLPRVVALTEPEHFVARRVMEKVGMSHEGEATYYGRNLALYVISGLGDTA
jgi:ribosomal-protein-alanine N-acetyltransferase